MALALLVSRFDSKYVDPPAVTVGLLYFYAVIQGAWPVFRYEDDLMLVLTFVALVLKCLLFLFVSWLFESHPGETPCRSPVMVFSDPGRDRIR